MYFTRSGVILFADRRRVLVSRDQADNFVKMHFVQRRVL